MNEQKMTLERAAEILDPTHREHYESIDPVNEACEIGRKAILKQIPLPIKVLSYYKAECPNCGSYDLGEEVWGCAYCPGCGQALEWGENK